MQTSKLAKSISQRLISLDSHSLKESNKVISIFRPSNSCNYKISNGLSTLKPRFKSSSAQPYLETISEEVSNTSETTKSGNLSLSSSPSIIPEKNFLGRHIGSYSSESDVQKMLEEVGVPSLDALVEEAIPSEILMPDWSLSTIEHGISPESKSEAQCLTELQSIASMNKSFKSYLGMGYHNSVLPEVIKRHILEDSTWYTAYTPYQAEISQGRLESLLNYQTLICELTGMDISNASLLDESSAAAEAMIISHKVAGSNKKNVFFISSDVHQQTIDVIKTRAELLGIEIIVGDHAQTNFSQMENFFGALVQYPNTKGKVYDYSQMASDIKAKGGQFVVASDPLSLCILKPPSEFGADIVVGTSQRFGVPMGFGGPHAAFIATSNKNTRRLPGRIIGASLDSFGNTAYRMALQTREQHIRRDKATSNICTAQALLANVAAMYAVYHGPDGLKLIAQRVHQIATVFKNGLNHLGYNTPNENLFFDTITVDTTPQSANEISSLMHENGINIRVINNTSVSLSFDETTTFEDIQKLLDLFAQFKGLSPIKVGKFVSSNENIESNLGEFYRTTSYLKQANFNFVKSETEMMRYMKRLEKKDLALNSSMISLGSCTMKLNPTSALSPILWPNFANMHPFAPPEQTKGYQKLILDLSNYLSFITGFDGVSLQPNSGATGEFAGLIAIKKYQQSIGQGHRNICLIPKSAHGTNPASAAMAGMTIKLIDADKEGKISIDQVEELAKTYKDSLSALMITYPSTMGVFEKHIEKICEIIHTYGGNVYMDGANMNAQLGVTSPGFIGADVCHLNLHKTFAIPHGGGGPGVGPICVKKHLIPFLMSHSIISPNQDHMGPPVSGAPYGSAMVLPISWMFINLLGLDGLKNSGQFAILNANYMMNKLKKHFSIKFSGLNGRCAHEFIIGVEEFKKTADITEEDIAKRLMDYGFHAPTMSWPISSSLMIEPTESEDKSELDRFCDAMISIREEIRKIENGTWPKDDNPIKNSPHTEEHITSDTWNHPYSRQIASFPLPWIKQRGKFWPSVSRINNAYGERNLVCTCS